MNGKQTVFDGAGRKPRNLQAALIFTKAKPFHLPPTPEPRPVIVETSRQRIARENRERSERVAILRKEKEEHDRNIEAMQRAMRFRQKQQRKNRKPNAIWLARLLRKQAKARGEKPDNNAIKQARKEWVKSGKKGLTL